MLRGGSSVPTSQAFLDNVDPQTQPYMSFNDIEASGRNVVALFGPALVELWRVDLTGKERHDFIDDDQANRLTIDMQHCADQPCRIWEVSTLRTTSGRVIAWEMVTLPLSLDGPSRSRIARYHNILELTDLGELIQDILHFQRKDWIDVGAGVPTSKPLIRAS
jgi:hypothetical protein